MTLGRAGEAMDEQPGKRQRDGQQHPAPQPAREKYPHDEVPSSGPRSRLCRVQHPSPPRRWKDRSALRPGSCLPDTFRCSRPRYPQRGVVITTPMRPTASQGHCCVMSSRAASKHDAGCSAGQMVITRSSKAMRSLRAQRRRDQFAEDPRAGRGTTGGDLGRDRARAQRPGKEAPGGRKVTPPGQQDVDDLAMLVDRPVQGRSACRRPSRTSHRRTTGHQERDGIACPPR